MPLRLLKLVHLLFFVTASHHLAYAQCSFAIIHNNADDHCLYAEEDVVWRNATGVIVSGNTVTKGLNSANWNAGALSVNTVKDNGWVSVTVDETNTDRMFGLASSPSVTPSMSRANYGIYLRSDGTFWLYESGTFRGNPSGHYGNNTYVSGDEFYIKVERGVVKYYHETTLLLISGVMPTLPLTVEATLNSWSPASKISNVKVSNGTDGTFIVDEVVPGVGATYEWFLDGVNVSVGTTYVNTNLTSTNVLSCVLTTGNGGCLPEGTQVTSNLIRFTSVSPTSFGDYGILNDAADYACLNATEPVIFSSLVNARATSNAVVKTHGSTFSFDAGAFGVNEVHNNGAVEAKVPQNNRTVLFGLSSSNSTGYGVGSIQFAFYARNDGQLQIYESSSLRTTIGAYAANDVLKIEVENSVVKYYVNGSLKYTSTLVPALPLFPDVSFIEIGGQITDVFVKNGSTGSFALHTSALGSSPSYQWKVNSVDVGTDLPSLVLSSISDGDLVSCEVNTSLVGCPSVTTSSALVESAAFRGTAYITASSSAIACSGTEEEITFADQVNVSVSTNSVLKILGTSGFWDAGATSLNKVYKNGYAKVTASQTNTDRFFGLSSDGRALTHSSPANNTIQYAIQLAGNGSYYVYESGNYRNITGSYSVGDVFKIKIDNDVVRYYRNSGSGDILLYSSTISPVTLLPLVVDISLSTKGTPSASIDNVVVSNGSNGIFSAITSNMGANPLYEWKVNGLDVGSNSATYTNSMLSAGDQINCFITPDLVGCSASSFLSNSIIIHVLGGPSSPTTTWTGLVSSAWDNPSNWTSGVPAGYHKATIPAGTPNSPSLNITDGAVYDLVINSGVSFSIAGTNSLTVFNKWENNGVFNANTSTISFKNCTDNSNFILTALPENFNKVKIDNVNGVEISGEHHISASLNLNAVIDYTAPSDIVVFENDAFVSGVSSTSFFRGKVKKVGDDAFVFPIGKGNVYRHLAIGAPASITDAFTAEYFKANSVSAYGGSMDAGLWTVSGCEYWTLERSGISIVEVQLSWNAATGCDGTPYISDPNDLRVTFWNGSRWKDAGNVSTSGDADNGTITSDLTITDYIAFTLGSVSSSNPLPIEISHFHAKLSSRTVSLQWATEVEIETEYYIVERSDSTLTFEPLGKVLADGMTNSTNNYAFDDKFPLQGRSYYRLKIVDTDGSTEHSRIISVQVNHDDDFDLFPNPVRNGQTIKVFGSPSRLIIMDHLQRIVADVTNPEEVHTEKLPAGVYFCFNEDSKKFERLVVYD